MLASTGSAAGELGDQRVILTGIPWRQYLALNTAAGDRPGLRMTYLDGILEIMSPSERHEGIKTFLARVVETYCVERDIPLLGIGSTTLRRKVKAAGIEPDECYYLGARKEFPDLAFEVVVTSGGLDKLEVYQRLDVAEVWFWIEDRIQVHRLGPKGYRRVARSQIVPGLDVAAVARIVATPLEQQHQALRRFQRALRDAE